MKIRNQNTKALFVFDNYNLMFCVVKLLLTITALSAIEAYDPIRPESIAIITILNGTVLLSLVLTGLYFKTKHSYNEKIPESITVIASLLFVVEFSWIVTQCIGRFVL